MNNYRKITKCRCCEGELLEVLNLTDQPLANSYHPLHEKLPTFPLKLNLCKICFHTQLSVVVDPDEMFKHYLYVSGTTQTLKEYFDFFAKFTIHRFKTFFNVNAKTVLDIACNDGTQLNFYKNKGLETFGIDPAENLHEISSKEHNVICDYFPSNKLNRKYNIIVAQNVFAHTHTIFEFLTKCSELLEENGLIYIQTSQANMIKNNEFDTIYHEHLSFFNSLSMKTIVERCGLKLNNVFKFDIHGTSYIFEISKHNLNSNLESVLKEEAKNGIYNIETYQVFAQNAKSIAIQFKKTIEEYRNKGYDVIGYGAAAKGMTFLNFAQTRLYYIIDDNKMKHDLYSPGSDTIIKGIETLAAKNKEHQKILFVPLAWNFYTEIRERIKKVRDNENDLFLKYFPKVKVLK